MEALFNLNDLINKMSFPANGSQLLSQCHRNLPEDFCIEITPKIKNISFDSPKDLKNWFSENLTTHMAGLLGGESVQQLIEKRKKAA